MGSLSSLDPLAYLGEQLADMKAASR